MAEVNIRKNWKKKITAICDGITEATLFCITYGHNLNDIPVKTVTTLTIADMEGYVIDAMTNRGGTLSYRKDTGEARLNIPHTGNLSWTANKFEW